MIAAAVPFALAALSLATYAWLLLGRPGRLALAGLELLALGMVAVGGSALGRGGSPRAGAPPRTLAWILGAAVLVAAVGSVHVLRQFPDGMWMAVDIWSQRAAYLVHVDLPTMLQAAYHHRDYPLLLPLSITSLWAWTGRVRAVPIGISLAFAASAAAILYAGVARLGGAARAAAVTAALLASPWWVIHGAGQQADVPLAVFALLAGVTLSLQRRDPHPALALSAGVAIGAGAWTKNEGILIAAVFLTVWALRRGRGWVWILAGAAPFAAAVLHHKLTCGATTDLVAGQGEATWARIAEPGRFVLIGRAFLETVGPYVAIGAALAWALGTRWRALARELVVPAFVLIGYAGVYLVTPYDLAWHLGSSLDRLALHLWPLALLAVGAAAKRVDPEPAEEVGR